MIERSASTTTAYGTADAATTYTSYNAQGQVAIQTDANGNVTTYLYDNAGREISITQPPVETGGPSAVTSYTYNAAGQQTSMTDAHGNMLPHTDFNGITTTYTYDSLNRETSVTSASSVVSSYSYTPDGQIATMTDGTGTTTYTHMIS